MRWARAVGLFTLLYLAGCSQDGATRDSGGDRSAQRSDGLRGRLLIIGGGLDDDNRPVYERFMALARAAAGGGPPRILIATAASGNESENSTGKRESLRAYCGDCLVDAIGRGTPANETIAKIDAAHAMFFTGGDQKRITQRYLASQPTDPRDSDTVEAAAMRRLLARGGVIAGTSAGDAMMSDPMFLSGGSAAALGVRMPRKPSNNAGEDDQSASADPPLGPRIGKGMGFLPWAITDSHFFERHRFGRLVAALEASGKRLGIGVGEDACVEVDLSSGDLIGVSVADSLLIDAGGLTRDGLARRGIRARVIRQGTRVNLKRLLASQPAKAAARPAETEDMALVEPGQNRQLAAWRFFVRSQNPAQKFALRLRLEGYAQIGWPTADEWSHVEIHP